MKRSATILICSLLLVLSGCAMQQNNSLPDISSSQTTDMEQPEAQESAEEQQTTAATAQTTTSAATQQTSESATTVQTTTASTTAQTTASTTAPTEKEPVPDETGEYYTSDAYTEESNVEVPAEDDIYEPVIDVPVYSDSNLGDYVLLTVVPEKIYWNELDYFHPTEGEEFTMLFPSFFYETFKESDSVVLRFDTFDGGSSQRKESLKSQCGGCDFIYSYVRPSDSWEKDMLFQIKDGKLAKLDCEKYIKTYYNDYEAKSWVMSDHKDEFYYGMTVDEVDDFMANQHAECVEAEEYWNKIIEEDPNNAVDFEMSHSYFTWGMVMRVKLAEDHSTSDTETNITAMYDDVFEEIDETTPSGPRPTYEEEIEMLSETVYGGIDSFYLVETVKALTLSECEQLRGWDEWFESCYALSYDEIKNDDREYFGDKIIYEVKVIEDLISGEESDRKMYLSVGMGGNPRIQRAGDPIYAPGERFTVAVHQKPDDSDITRSCGGFMFRYDAVEDASGSITLYSRNSAMDDLDLPNAVAIEKTVITSTTKNPAHYTCKLPLDDLVAFLRQDWENRQISRHFTTAVYDDVFRGAAGSAAGAPMTYEDVMSMIASGEEHGEYLDSLYLVETVKALTAKECAKLDGWDITYSDRTIYEVNIIEDLISGDAVGRKEYIFVSMGNAQWQNKGDPIYAPGEKFTVALTKPQQGCDFLRTPGSFMFRYDAVEDASGNITLYSRNSAMDELDLPNAVAIEKTVITSTTNNPAHYTCKIPLDDLVEFLRQDWEKRQISRHFTTAVTTDCEAVPHPEIPADVVRYVHKTTYGDFYYFAADIVIDKIYYNDLPHVKTTVGDTVKIIFPCERYADISETDQIILNFDGTENTNGFWGTERDGLFFDTPADYYYAYHSWDADSIFFIEDNKLSALSMSEDERYSFLVAEHYKKFYYGMAAEAVDEFIMEHRADDLAEKDFVPPDGMEIEYGISAFMFVDGLRIKGHVGNIYTNS